MQSRKIARIIALLLVVVLVLTFVISAVSYVALAAPSETEIENIEAENQELDQKIIEVESKINSIEYENLSLLEKKEMLDALVILSESKISNFNKRADAYDTLAVELQEELTACKEIESRQQIGVTNRIRAFEENGVLAYFGLVLEADSFLDFLGRVDLMSTVIKYDEYIFDAYAKAKENIQSVLAKIDGLEAEQNSARQSVIEAEAERDKYTADAEAFITTVQGKQSTYEQLCNELDDGEKTFENVIANKKAEQIRLSPKIEAGTGVFSWPVKASNTVILSFGTKLNQAYKLYRVHKGIDISAEYGSAVTSADKGMVTAVGYDPIYGNYVVINHGNGYETLYAQLSIAVVSEGEQLNSGTVIGKVGSTGCAANAHLHFEIRLDEVSVNPLTFFEGYISE